MMGRRCFLFFFLLLFMLMPLQAFASEYHLYQSRALDGFGAFNRTLSIDPIGRSEGFSAVLYDNTNGLPTAEANAIVETPEGFIWIGSYSGLIRYDGNTFERIDSTDGISSVVCLFVDSQDRLWIGTNDSGVAVMERGEIHKWGTLDGLQAAGVRAIMEDTSGRVYVATTAGIDMIGPDKAVVPLNDERIHELSVIDLRMGVDQLIYGLTNLGDLFTIKDGRIISFLSHEEIRVKGVMCLLPDPLNPGYVYVGTESSEIYYGNLEKNFAAMGVRDISPLVYSENLEFIEGRLWICAGNGIGVFDKEEGLLLLENVPMNNSVGSVMVDYEGNLWFTSTRQGLMKIVPNQFTDIYEKYSLPENVVNSTCMYGKSLFVGTDSGLMVLDKKGVVSSIPVRNIVTASGERLEVSDLAVLLKDCRVRSIIIDSRERLWISTWRKYGLICFDQGDVTVFTKDDGLVSDLIRTVYERQDGSILVACTGGVNVIEENQVVATYGEMDGITNTSILTVTEGFGREIILGTDGGGIFILDEDGCRHLGTMDGLSSEVIMRIKPDPERKIYWIVTSNSLAYMTADGQITTIQDFPYANNFDLYENSLGDVWILSSNGIYVEHAQKLLDNQELQPVYYGRANGLRMIATANSYSGLTADGDLYIAASTGVTKVNIEKDYEEISDLKMAVPFLEADENWVYPNENGEFILPPQIKKLTIPSFVFNYSLLDPQVSYQLEGFDKNAVTVRRSDLLPADYTNLPGGIYRFVLKLSDPMGRGSEQLSVKIIKQKALYEQIWFYIPLTLLLLTLMSASVRLYVRRRMSKLEKRHQEEVEKERISTELQTASQIQKSMLPGIFPAFPEREEFDIYATMEPAKEVGGDFFDFFLIDTDHLAIVMADVSGKGVPAALFMMMAKTILQSNAIPGRSAAEILTRTNHAVCANNQMEMFVTVWLGILEISTGRMRAANAGHEYPVIKQGNTFSVYKDKHGFVVGAVDGMKYKEYSLQLHPGDKLFLYTDGIPEAENQDGEMFSPTRMVEALNKKPDGTTREIMANVRSAVADFVGEAEQFDDLTMLCLDYRG
ncbi:MAG: SpoIIE family protein phosphatase [Blautia sp.]|nr:SpoIIE family protein phosphatase [Blautia sp.]